MRKILLGFAALLAIVLTVAPVQAATKTITDCDGADVTKQGKFTVVNFPNDDVVIQCTLDQLAGTGDGIKVIGATITIDGPAGGQILASGKGDGLQLLAGGVPGCAGIDPTLGHGSITITNALVQNGNNNGNVLIRSCGNLDVDSVGGAVLRAGDNVDINCLVTGCVMNFTDAVLEAAPAIIISADSDITMVGTSLKTESPRDFINITSRNGSVIAGAGTPTNGSCFDEETFPPGGIHLLTPEQAQEFCDNNCECEGGGNSIDTGVEGNLSIVAKVDIILTGACVYVAEEIELIAQTGLVDLENAQIRNDYGKTGQIIVSANGGTGTIKINDAIIVDGGKAGGNDDPNDVASLNGNTGKQDNPGGTCSGETCPFKGGGPLPIVNQLKKAARTGAPGVIGTAKCDM
jgi:hypothetical protein